MAKYLRATGRDDVAALAKLDYPRDKLRIQILDDSTDDTVVLTEEGCAWLRKQGIDAAQLRVLVYLSIFVLPEAIAVIGVVAWWLRREAA